MHISSVSILILILKKEKKKILTLSHSFSYIGDERFVITEILEQLPYPLYILKSIDTPESDEIDGKFYESEIFLCT